MAYTLQSLVKVIELIISHEKQHEYFDNDTTPQLHSLLEKTCFLRDSFEKHPILSQQHDSFEDRIRDVAQNAEDVLETYIAYFATEHAIPTPNLQNLLERLHSIEDEMMKILDGDQTSGDRALPVVASSSRSDLKLEKVVVGFTDDLLKLKDRVFGDSSKLEIIPIVGMGGIGKTTLARKLYDDSSVVSEFDVRAWATVSDNYSLHDILRSLLGYKRDEMAEVEANTLGLTLYQSLMGKRYIIVLDDIWRFNAWDDVKKSFPNENNRSRVILTTRQSDVATYVDSKSPHHEVHPLNEVHSWELLRKKVFGEDTCLPELEELGIKIANSCGGLPLAIQVIGGILSQTERTKNSWEQVASNVISAIANKEEQVSGILALSYRNLPYYLKPCFLYMSAFPEDYDIVASTLTRMWIAEGFLKLIQGKCLEEVAEEHLNTLINRNLIFVRNRTTRRRVKTLGIHDLLRDLCALKAREQKFSYLIDGSDHIIPSQDISCLRRVSFLAGSCIDDIPSDRRHLMEQTRSLTNLFLSRSEGDNPLPQYFPTLRLLSATWREPLEEVLRVFNLRYLSLRCGREIDPYISTLRNLQILIIETYGRVRVPHELFEMPHLREISSGEAILFCDFKESNNIVLQENLHTVSRIEISANIDAVLAKFPKLRKLGLKYTKRSHTIGISCFQKLEKLHIHGNKDRAVARFLSGCSPTFTLKAAYFTSLTVPEACMTTLGMFLNLEILMLMSVTFEPTDTWKLSTEDKFCKLKILGLVDLELVTWEANETHFPVLEQLVINCCYSLDELPSAIGEIPTLKRLIVRESSPAVEAWARQIEEEQLDYGNDLLQVCIEVED